MCMRTKIPRFYLQAVEKSRNVKNEHRDAMIRQYFYGTTVFSLSTYTIEVKFSDVKIVKVGAATSSDSKGSDHCTKVTTVEPGKLFITFACKCSAIYLVVNLL